MAERHELSYLKSGDPMVPIIPAHTLVRIWSEEWRCWWRPRGSGYTDDIRQAGVYSFSEAWRRSAHCGPEKQIWYEVVGKEAETPSVIPQQRYRHLKSGGEYQVVALARMQAKDWNSSGSPDSFQSIDMEQVVVYRSLSDGEVWVRPIRDFCERFELLG